MSNFYNNNNRGGIYGNQNNMYGQQGKNIYSNQNQNYNYQQGNYRVNNNNYNPGNYNQNQKNNYQQWPMSIFIPGGRTEVFKKIFADNKPEICYFFNDLNIYYFFMLTAEIANWHSKKNIRGRKGQGTGRMKYLKDIPRKFRNHFKCENVEKNALPEKPEKEKKEVKYSKIPRRKLH